MIRVATDPSSVPKYALHAIFTNSPVSITPETDRQKVKKRQRDSLRVKDRQRQGKGKRGTKRQDWGKGERLSVILAHFSSTRIHLQALKTPPILAIKATTIISQIQYTPGALLPFVIISLC